MPESSKNAEKPDHLPEEGSRANRADDDNPGSNSADAKNRELLLTILAGLVIFAASVALVVYASSVKAATPVAPGPAQAVLSGHWLIIGIVVLALILVGLHAKRIQRIRTGSESETRPPANVFQFSSPGNVENDNRLPGPGNESGYLPDYAELRRALRWHWENGRRQSSYLALAVIEVDDFHALTDAFGQARVDHLLKEMAYSLNSLVESHGGLFACRTDGQSPGKFMALLPNTTPDRALAIAEELRLTVEDLGFDRPPPSHGVMTASVGVCIMVPSNELSRDQLLSTATAALHRARERGRNRAETEMVVSEV